MNEKHRIGNLQVIASAFSQELVDLLENLLELNLIEFNPKRTLIDRRKQYKSTNPFQYLHRQNLSDCISSFEKLKELGFADRYLSIIELVPAFLENISSKALGSYRGRDERLSKILKAVYCGKIVLILNSEIARYYKVNIGAYQLNHHRVFESELKKIFKKIDSLNKEFDFTSYDKFFERFASDDLSYTVGKINELTA